MRLLALFLLMNSCAVSAFSQSKTIQELKDSNRIQLGLHFYPSTLRMLNLQKDTAYNKMVRGIEKLSFLITKPDKFGPDLYIETTGKLINQEQYEEYIIWQGEDYQMEVVGKPKKKEMVGLANYNDRYYIFDLKGTIDLLQLPALYEKLSSQDSTMQNGFSYIFDMIERDEAHRLRREKWQKEQEERRRKEAAEKNKEKKDSIHIESGN